VKNVTAQRPPKRSDNQTVRKQSGLGYIVRCNSRALRVADHDRHKQKVHQNQMWKCQPGRPTVLEYRRLVVERVKAEQIALEPSSLVFGQPLKKTLFKLRQNCENWLIAYQFREDSGLASPTHHSLGTYKTTEELEAGAILYLKNYK